MNCFGLFEEKDRNCIHCFVNRQCKSFRTTHGEELEATLVELELESMKEDGDVDDSSSLVRAMNPELKELKGVKGVWDGEKVVWQSDVTDEHINLGVPLSVTVSGTNNIPVVPRENLTNSQNLLVRKYKFSNDPPDQEVSVYPVTVDMNTRKEVIRPKSQDELKKMWKKLGIAELYGGIKDRLE